MWDISSTCPWGRISTDTGWILVYSPCTMMWRTDIASVDDGIPHSFVHVVECALRFASSQPPKVSAEIGIRVIWVFANPIVGDLKVSMRIVSQDHVQPLQFFWCLWFIHFGHPVFYAIGSNALVLLPPHSCETCPKMHCDSHCPSPR